MIYLHSKLPKGLIAFQGVEGAYSHRAARDVFPDWDMVGFPDGFNDAVEAVRNGSATAAVIPVDNTLAGRVGDVHDLLPDTGLFSVFEHYLFIHHCLAGVGRPGDLENHTVRNVYSHPHALGQCRKFIKEHELWSHVYFDTAKAAVKMAEDKDPTQAAICSEEAAVRNGLTILAKNIQDTMKNTTRFIVLARELIVPPVGTNCKMTLWFELPKDKPGGLVDAICGFREEGINMTKLESYQDEEFNPANFLVEIQAHPEDDATKRALGQLESASKDMKLLGVYPEALKPWEPTATPVNRHDKAPVLTK